MMDERGLRLFPFPGRDAVFAALQHALLGTYQEVSLASCGAGVGGVGPTSRAEHPGGILPRLDTVKGVLDYREAARREFVRSVARGTHHKRDAAIGQREISI